MDPCILYSSLTRQVTKEHHNPTTGAVKCAAGSTAAATCGHFSPDPPPPPAGCGGGSLSSTVPFSKHMPPVDPTWPSNYAQELKLLYEYVDSWRGPSPSALTECVKQ